MWKMNWLKQTTAAVSPVNLIMWLRWVNQVRIVLMWAGVGLRLQCEISYRSQRTCSVRKAQSRSRSHADQQNKHFLNESSKPQTMLVKSGIMCCVCSSQDRLQSLVFGLLRQRKLDFLDIYSEEMVRAAKNVVRQVRHTTDTLESERRWISLSLSLSCSVLWSPCRRSVRSMQTQSSELWTYVFSVNMTALFITADAVSVCDAGFMSRCAWWRFISGSICCWIFLNTSSCSSRGSR